MRASSIGRVRAFARPQGLQARTCRRWYNGSTGQPHTTYFQEPPQQPRRIGRTIFTTLLFGSLCAVAGAYSITFYLARGLEDLLEESSAIDDGAPEDVQAAALARQVPAVRGEIAELLLRTTLTGFSVTPTAVSHFSQLPSNLPCEDAMGSGTYTFHSDHFKDPSRDWSEWGIYDGHAGPRTAQLLRELLPLHMGGELWDGGCMDRPYKPNDAHIIETIKKAFVKFDNHLFEEVGKRLKTGEGSRADMVSLLANVMSGSCALFAIFDPKNMVVRVANVGDSRAVLGRWDDAQGGYVPQLMSIDQTGFNQAEADRIAAEHPGEDVVDPKSGRVHGIMVSRAFGDARWKWPQELNKLAHERYWGPKPRPDGKILTPPYLTAEPDVIEAKVQGGAHPDFLIMASDGFWDRVSNDDAVALVQNWLTKNKPTDFLEHGQDAISDPKRPISEKLNDSRLTYTNAADMHENDDTFFSEAEDSLKWRVSPKHFVNDDEHCGVHLLKNALGGKRRDLLEGVLTVQPPLSRNVRDDISVNIIFFGVEAIEAAKQAQEDMRNAANLQKR